ncbi:hypothetical protein ACFX2I_004213 [Malus domestica]|uniref:ankyrin repeat-containing protein At5g02620-like n=1 Tax=Malus domestica TaxID=3750 RepID=UPI0007EDA713|nr:ankyrin repeat-containing protein At5g02620-like [Malus domestica]
MDPSLYKAATSGDIRFLRSDRFLDQKTPKDNNIFHVAAEFKQADFFKNVPLDVQSSLFWATNKKGDTPLHVAAGVGCHEIVKFLIQHAKETQIHGADQESGPADKDAHKELFRMTNLQKDTALHVAVRNDHGGVVMLLMEADPQLCCFTNGANESPLFLAVRSGSPSIAIYILNHSDPVLPSFHGTNGVTALHAAVTHKHLTGRGIVEMMVSKNPDVIRKADALGWTPLHYAALRGNLEATRVLMQYDSSASYILDKSGISALHVAAYAGCIRVMEEMIRHRPDTCDLLNDKGQTILHAAVLGEQIHVVSYILNNPMFAGLINEADKDGNTPLHLAARYQNRESIRILTDDPKVDKTAINEEFSRAIDFFLGDNSGEQEIFDNQRVLHHLGRSTGVPFFQQQINRDFKKLICPDNDTSCTPAIAADKREKLQAHSDLASKRLDTNLLVGVLIATVTFTAAFTPPGGFKSDGTPVLNENTYFQAFLMFDFISFFFSSLAILNDFLVATVLPIRLAAPASLIQLSIGGMMVAFTSGALAVQPKRQTLTLGDILVSIIFVILFLVAVLPMVKSLFQIIMRKKYPLTL